MISWHIFEPDKFGFPATGAALESSPLTLPEVAECAAQLAPLLRAGLEVGLEGELGAGKTTLVRLLGEALRCVEPVSSPTFTLCHEYHLTEPSADGLSRIEHWDLYRVNGTIEELRAPAGQDSLRLVEWHERMPILGPRLSLRIQLEYVSLGAEVADGLDARIIRLWSIETLAPQVKAQLCTVGGQYTGGSCA
jgi:tRNA threonylcarbamoyladenosine biosynthesis protein TsaE